MIFIFNINFDSKKFDKLLISKISKYIEKIKNIEIIANKSLIFSYKVNICIGFGYFLLSNLSQINPLLKSPIFEGRIKLKHETIK